MDKFDFIGCKADANLYKHKDGNLFILCCVDDLLIVGDKDKVEGTFNLLETELLIRKAGVLYNKGDKLEFLGRQLEKTSDSILICVDSEYVEKILEESRMKACRAAAAPGNGALQKKVEDEEPLFHEEHRKYRRLVGQLFWMSPIRPDLTFAVKELSRGVSSPTLTLGQT